MSNPAEYFHFEFLADDLRAFLSRGMSSWQWSQLDADPEDVIQETLIRIMRSDAPARCEGPAALTVFARTISRNLIIDLTRKFRRRHSVLAEHSDICRQLKRQPTQDELNRTDSRLIAAQLLSLLSLEDRIVLEQFFFSNLSTAEIAGNLKISTKTCQRRIKCLIDRLRVAAAQNAAHAFPRFHTLSQETAPCAKVTGSPNPRVGKLRPPARPKAARKHL